MNHSDHLPISTVLRISTPISTSEEPTLSKRVDWAKALNSNKLVTYQQQVTSTVRPLLENSHYSAGMLNEEMCSVSQQLHSAALTTLPLRAALKRQKKWYNDQSLSRLAKCKKAAWDEGPLYDAKIKTRCEFRKRMKVCVASTERKRIQHFDQQFRERSAKRFNTPSRKHQDGTIHCELVNT